VVGEVDDEINEDTDDVVTSFTYTAAPEDPGDLPGGLLWDVTDALARVTERRYFTNPALYTFGLLQTVRHVTREEFLQAHALHRCPGFHLSEQIVREIQCGSHQCISHYQSRVSRQS
jgi:hypothetical protein